MNIPDTAVPPHPTSASAYLQQQNKRNLHLNEQKIRQLI